MSNYDNIELNELLRNLENYSDQNKKSTTIRFQYPDELKEPNFGISNIKSKPVHDNEIQYNVKNDNYDGNDVKNLKDELTLVKQELAVLKRSQSLANHPIFSAMNNTPPNDFKANNVPNKIIRMDHKDTHSNSFGPISNRSGSNMYIDNSTNPNKFQYHSMTRLNTIPSYSAHRENIERLQYRTSSRDRRNSTDISSDNGFSDIEDCCLKPLGMGINSLSDSLSTISKVSYDSTRNEFNPSSMLMRVKRTKDLWLKLDASRETCRQLLFPKEPGSFIIRIQSEYKIRISCGVIFELVMKVRNIEKSHYICKLESFEYFTLKEFTETSKKGLKIIGNGSEPMFNNLEQFVCQHLISPFGLSICLKLPGPVNKESDTFISLSKAKLSRPIGYLSKKLSGSQKSINSQVTVTYSEPQRENLSVKLMFLGKVKVDRIYGQNAIRHAVDKMLINNNQPKYYIEVNVLLDSIDGITITDKERILFFQKNISVSDIIFCGIDPLRRGLKSELFISNGVKNSRIFGVLSQKTKMFLKQQKVYLFSEFDSSILMENILKFIQRHIINKNNGFNK